MLSNPVRQFPPVPQPPLYTAAWSWEKLWLLLCSFGPAAIAASVSIGAGETILVVRAGAWSQYQLLWLILLSCLAKGIFVTYLLGRYTVICGEPIANRLARLPGPRGWFLLAILGLELATAPLYWTAISKPCGALLTYLAARWMGDSFVLSTAGVHVMENLVATAIVLTAVLLGFGFSYEKLEKQQIVFCGVLVTGTIIGTILVYFVKPEFVATLKGFIPSRFQPAPWAGVPYPYLAAATLFGYVGNTVLGYVVYANWVGLHRWGMTGHPELPAMIAEAQRSDRIEHLPTDAESVREIRAGLIPLRWDVGMGALVLFVVSSAFLMSGAAVLYPQQEAAWNKGLTLPKFEGWSLLTDQAAVWDSIHPALVWVYYAVILVALWGTLQAFPDIYARVAVGFSEAVWPGRPASFRRAQTVIGTWLVCACLVLIWSNVNFNLLTEAVGFLTTNVGVTLMMLAALYLNQKLPAAYRTRRWMWVGGVLSCVVLATATFLSGQGLSAKLHKILTETLESRL